MGLSFRASTGMIALGYAVIAAVLVLALGSHLEQAVPGYVPQVSWLMRETTAIRMAALRAAGRPETAALYAYVAALSWSTVAALTAGGFAWGVMNKGDTALGVDKALNYLTAIAVLYALATTTEVLMHLLPTGAPQGGLHAMPVMWFATMIPSAAILARVGALIAHDAGSLITIAVEGDPAELAAFAARAKERRGASSLEARLARSMVRLRKPA